MVDKKINYCSSIKCSKKMVKIIQQILTGQCFALENPCYTASGTLELQNIRHWWYQLKFIHLITVTFQFTDIKCEPVCLAQCWGLWGEGDRYPFAINHRLWQNGDGNGSEVALKPGSQSWLVQELSDCSITYLLIDLHCILRPSKWPPASKSL